MGGRWVAVSVAPHQSSTAKELEKLEESILRRKLSREKKLRAIKRRMEHKEKRIVNDEQLKS